MPVVECYYVTSDPSLSNPSPATGTLNITVGAAAGALSGVPYIGGLPVSASYNSGTAYTPGQIVYETTGPNNGIDFYGSTFYECIQGGTGQTPHTSPSYWAPVTVRFWSNHGAQLNNGTPYADQQGMLDPAAPQYSASATYYTGAVVADSENYIYRCASTTTGNAPVPLTVTSYWIPYAGVGGAGGAEGPYEPISPVYLQLQSVTIAGQGTFVTGCGGQFANANPLGSTLTTETELGPGFVRYSWPCGSLTSGVQYTVTVN